MGRVILLNSVLKAILIFFLSFLTMIAKVWKKLIRIQRRFMCRGVKGLSKILWVRWSEVCTPKKFGGFSRKDLCPFNPALLSKWR